MLRESVGKIMQRTVEDKLVGHTNPRDTHTLEGTNKKQDTFFFSLLCKWIPKPLNLRRIYQLVITSTKGLLNCKGRKLIKGCLVF